MGSYDVACGLSSLPIGYEDKAGFLVLRPQKNYNRTQLKPSGKTIQIYNTDNFMPVLPPIFGTYNTYGSLENIIPSVTTQLLETMYLQPIEVIMECFGNQDRAIYSSLGPIHKHYSESGSRMGDYGATTEEKILSLGFTQVSNSLFPEFAAYSFNNFALTKISSYAWVVFDNAGVQNGPEFSESDLEDNLTMFAQITGCYPGFKSVHWKLIEELAATSGMFFNPTVLTKITESISDTFSVESDNKKKADAWVEFMKSFTPGYMPHIPEGFPDMSSLMDRFEPDANGRRVFASAWGLPMNEYLTRNTALTPQNFDLLHIYNGSTEFSLLWDILNVTDALNRTLAPSMYAGERFEFDVFNDLADVMKEIVAQSQEESE